MKLDAFQKTAITTVIATLILIVIGGLVRAAGAGLGCPDWPKCFGMWIPPTHLSELPSQFDSGQFNVYKTWLEYINRLVGVVIGFLITITFLLSFRYRRSNPAVFISSLGAFVLVLFQGWLGGVVVRTGLQAGMITAHMLVAMLIMMLLLYGTFRATEGLFKFSIEEGKRKKLMQVMILLLGVTFLQMILGTQVREAIDLLKQLQGFPDREDWLDNIGMVFPIHRSFSWLLVVAAGYLFYKLRDMQVKGWIHRMGMFNILLILMQIGIGVGLHYLSMPPFLQVLHLFGMALMIGAQFLMILMLRTNRKTSVPQSV